MRRLFRQLDLTVCTGIFSGFLAITQFALEGGYWVYGALLAAISIMCFISYSEIRAYQKEINRLYYENKDLKSKVKNLTQNK